MVTTAKTDCPFCGAREFELRKVQNYQTELSHDGRIYDVTVPEVEVSRCDACGEETIGEEADLVMDAALRTQLGLLQPEEIRAHRKALGLLQTELADCLSIAVGTLSKWEKGHQIQQKAMDKLLRVFFEVPEARRRLGAPAATWARPKPDHLISNDQQTLLHTILLCLGNDKTDLHRAGGLHVDHDEPLTHQGSFNLLSRVSMNIPYPASQGSPWNISSVSVSNRLAQYLTPTSKAS